MCSPSDAHYVLPVQGDPILQGFDGRSFEFLGEVGSYYNVISEKEHQVSLRLLPDAGVCSPTHKADPRPVLWRTVIIPDIH